MNRRLLTFSSFAAALLLLSGGSTTATAAMARANSETIVRIFEQKGADGEEKTGIPAYEYLQLDFGQLDADGITGHLYGWGRYDFGDHYDDASEGEVLYGYLEYRASAGNLSARLGRQTVFDGIYGTSVDGLRVASDLGSYFAWSAYAGQPVALDTSNGSSGDSVWGARLSHSLGSLYNLGVSYKRADNDGDKDEELIAIDGSLTVLGPLSVHGKSVRNQREKTWQQHLYEARLAFGGLMVKSSYQRIDYNAFFDRKASTAKPFTDPLGGLTNFDESDEVATIMGGEVSWVATPLLELGASMKNYAYDVRTDEANYYAGLVTLHLEGDSSFGFELGRMDGGRDEDTYTLGRAYGYYAMGSTFLTADAVYAKYGETIFGDLGDDRSLFASLGGGQRFLGDAFKLKASVEYSKDPYFNGDVRGIVALEYDFAK